MQKSWYRINNLSALAAPVAAGKDSAPRIADIDILDEIGVWGITAEGFIRDIRSLGALDEIHLHIHSPGGSVFEGLAIYNYLRGHDATISVDVLGLAASMATVIAMAGDTVTMPANAYMMIHNVSGAAYGESKEMRKTADLIDALTNTIVGIYASRPEVDAENIRALMTEETWLSAEQALQHGLIDAITDEIKVAASVDMKKFDPSRLPADLAQAISIETAPVEPTEPTEPEAATEPTEPEAATEPEEEPAPSGPAGTQGPVGNPGVLEEPAPAEEPTLGARLLGWFGLTGSAGSATASTAPEAPPLTAAVPDVAALTTRIGELINQVDILAAQLDGVTEQRDSALAQVESVQQAMAKIETRMKDFDGAVQIRTLTDLAALGVPVAEVIPPSSNPDEAAGDPMETGDIEGLRGQLEQQLQANATERDSKQIIVRARRITAIREKIAALEQKITTAA